MPGYSENFYAAFRGGAATSAEEVVPIIKKLIDPQSVVDVGCGTGTWLSVFSRYGTDDILGIDGDYVNKEMLEIPESRFRASDLTQPFEAGRTYDLAVSLEVAEHLPPSSAAGFVQSLTALAPVVMFSAAIPFQGGTLHLNEQWPEYWAKLFAAHHYRVVDCIRERIWDNPNVEHWYAQNILLFVRDSDVQKYPALVEAMRDDLPLPLSLVHPRGYAELAGMKGVRLYRALHRLSMGLMRRMRRWRR